MNNVGNNTLPHINIFILSYERPSTTKKCIEFLQEKVTIHKKIFICDNNSSEPTKERLKKLGEKYHNIKIYWNNENRWVQGFNQAINENIDDYFVISDNDIFLDRVYPEDPINYMYMLLKKYDMGSIGMNIIGSDESLTGERPNTPDRNIIVTKCLDSTFQLMRKNLFNKNFNGVHFNKHHMGNRKWGVGWTCSPYYASHLDPTVERDMIFSGDEEYTHYCKEKVIHLERETLTKYDFMRNTLNAADKKT